MKIQDLKDNRTEIIEKLTSLFGQENLVSAMNILKNKAEYSEMFEPKTTIEEAIEDMEINCNFEKRKMKSADYLAALNNNSSETYALNHTIKTIKR